MSPAYTGITFATSSPSMFSTMADTAFSFEVLQTATLTPFAIASETSAFTPGRSGSFPLSTISMKMSVLRRCILSRKAFRSE